MHEIRRTYCDLCHARCGVLLHLEDGRPIKCEGDPSHLVSRGRLCPRGEVLLTHLDNKERLDYPLRRVGARGAGRWERVSWDDALNDITARLQELGQAHGPETLACLCDPEPENSWAARRFLNLFGSPNLFGTHSISHIQSDVAQYATYGGPVSPEIEHSSCIVLWGTSWSNSIPRERNR